MDMDDAALEAHLDRLEARIKKLEAEVWPEPKEKVVRRDPITPIADQ